MALKFGIFRLFRTLKAFPAFVPRLLRVQMIFKAVFTLLFASLVCSTPVREKRQTLARVVTKCSVPNTVALTFVGRELVLGLSCR